MLPISERPAPTLASLCRSGTASEVLAYLADLQVPRWRNQFRSRVNKKKRKRELSEEEEDGIEVPWLKKPKTVKEATPPETPPEKPFVVGPVKPAEIDLPPPSKSPLLDLCTTDDPEETLFLRKKLRILINTPDVFMRMPVHLAAFAGRCDVLELLLTSDGAGPWADIYAGAKDNMQPIHFAASAGHVAALKLCIKAGSRVNAATAKGAKTPLHFARQSGHQAAIDYLLSKGGRIMGEEKSMEEDAEFQSFLEAQSKLDHAEDLQTEDGVGHDLPKPAPSSLDESSATI